MAVIVIYLILVIFKNIKTSSPFKRALLHRDWQQWWRAKKVYKRKPQGYHQSQGTQHGSHRQHCGSSNVNLVFATEKSTSCSRSYLGKNYYSLAGGLKLFLEFGEILTEDQNILSILKGYKIPLNSNPVQIKIPNTHTSVSQVELVDQEISEMLTKGAMGVCNYHPNQFKSTLFLVTKELGVSDL